MRSLLIWCVVAAMSAAAGSTLVAQTTSDTAFVRPGVRPFDRPIDPDRYLVRPGERFEIVFVNTKLPDLWFEVNAEGRIVDRSLGVIDLAGATLRQARERLLPILERLYNAGQIEISVARLYPVAISVSGLVKAPGVYVGYTSQTVREIIDSAGGLAAGGSARRIVFSGGPLPVDVDLTRSLNRGEPEYDPCLYAGSRLEVPAEGDVAIISGEDFGPTAVELLDGDSLELLVSLAGGQPDRLDLGSARVVSDPSRDLSGPDRVRPGDRIWVPTAGRSGGRQGEVQVFGAVAAEGHYALGDGWTLQDLINAAGGLRPTAESDRIVVFRMARRYEPGPRGRYPLWSGEGGRSLSLEHMDSIFVPHRVGHVQVDGQVNRPGYFPFAEGRKTVDYIRMAGGYAETADRQHVRVLDRVSGLTRLVTPTDVVFDGDVITVREAEVHK